MIYNILDYGAYADGVTICTESIQKAIDDCHKNGGGCVLVPAGKYVSGTFYLKDNVELHLEQGALVKASPNINDYNDEDAYPQNFGCLAENWLGKHLVIALECKNVAITGFGVIDGNGEFFIEDMRPDCYHGYYGWRNGLLKCRYPEIQRPGQLICFIECENVVVENITAQNLTCWGCFFHGCENVQVKGIKVFSPSTTCNSDGIDIDCCRYVTVSNCIIRTGDDAIAVRCDSEKLKQPKPCEFITVTNCVLSSSVSVVRVGVGRGIIRHVRFSNITIEQCGTAFNFMTSYAHSGEAFIEDVNFSNISAVGVSFPWKLKGGEGAIKDITIENYRAHAIAFAEITALDKCKIENIRMSNIDICVEGEERELTEAILKQRGMNIIEVNNAQNITLDNINIRMEKSAEQTWNALFAANNCNNVKRINCNF